MTYPVDTTFGTAIFDLGCFNGVVNVCDGDVNLSHHFVIGLSHYYNDNQFMLDVVMIRVAVVKNNIRCV